MKWEENRPEEDLGFQTGGFPWVSSRRWHPLTLTADGMAIQWETGRFRINRSVFLPLREDDGACGKLLLDEELHRRGGYYARHAIANGYRLVSLNMTVSQWRLCLRLCRRVRTDLAKAEILRRFRAGQRFVFERADRFSFKAVLNPGRVPKEAANVFSAKAALFEDRLEAVKAIVDRWSAAGRTAAEEFAARSDIQEQGHQEAFRSASERVESARRTLSKRSMNAATGRT